MTVYWVHNSPALLFLLHSTLFSPALCVLSALTAIKCFSANVMLTAPQRLSDLTHQKQKFELCNLFQFVADLWLFSFLLRLFYSQEVCQTGVGRVMNFCSVCQKLIFCLSEGPLPVIFIPWHVRRFFFYVWKDFKLLIKREFVYSGALQSQEWCFYASHVDLSFFLFIQCTLSKVEGTEIKACVITFHLQFHMHNFPFAL